MHQHADDTTIHMSTADDLTTVIQEAVQPFCRASGARVRLPKSWGLTLGSHPSIVGSHGSLALPSRRP